MQPGARITDVPLTESLVRVGNPNKVLEENKSQSILPQLNTCPSKEGGGFFGLEQYCEWHFVEPKGEIFTARTGHGAVSTDEKIYIFGGADTDKRLNDFYEFNPWDHTWKQLQGSGKVPSARSGAKGAVFKDNIYYFGGYASKDGEYFNDLHMYSPKENTWKLLAYTGDSISPRVDHSLVLFGHSLYIFAGTDPKNKFNDLYKLNLTSLKCRKIKATGDIPTARFGHTADVHNSSMFIFGGWNGFETLGELYNYSIVSNIWYEEKFVGGSKPPGRYRHASAVIGNSLFVFGGIDKAQVKYNDLHEFDFDRREWRYIEATGLIPAPRTFHQCASFENKLYLFGGAETKKTNDTFYITVKNQVYHTETTTELEDVSQMLFFDSENKIKFVEENLQNEDQAAKLVKILTQQVEELKQRLKAEQERNVCAGCGEKEINAVFIGCGHRCMCYNCAVKHAQCPICKHRVNR